MTALVHGSNQTKNSKKWKLPSWALPWVLALPIVAIIITIANHEGGTFYQPRDALSEYGSNYGNVYGRFINSGANYEALLPQREQALKADWPRLHSVLLDPRNWEKSPGEETHDGVVIFAPNYEHFYSYIAMMQAVGGQEVTLKSCLPWVKWYVGTYGRRNHSFEGLKCGTKTYSLIEYGSKLN